MPGPERNRADSLDERTRKGMHSWNPYTIYPRSRQRSQRGPEIHWFGSERVRLPGGVTRSIGSRLSRAPKCPGRGREGENPLDRGDFRCRSGLRRREIPTDPRGFPSPQPLKAGGQRLTIRPTRRSTGASPSLAGSGSPRGDPRALSRFRIRNRFQVRVPARRSRGRRLRGARKGWKRRFPST